MCDRSSKRKRGRGSTRPLSRGCRLPACNGSSFAPRGVDAGGDGVGVLLESWVKDRSCYLHQLQRLAARTLLSCCNCNSHCLSGRLSTRCAVGQRAGSDRCTSARRTADVHVGTIESHPYRLALLHCCCIQRASIGQTTFTGCLQASGLCCSKFAGKDLSDHFFAACPSELTTGVAG